MDKLKKELSLYSVILALIVVLLHSLGEAITHYPKGALINIIFFIFHKATSFLVPAFIFLSGLKMVISLDLNRPFLYKKFILRRITKIYMPYIVCVTIFFLYFKSRGFISSSLNRYLEGILVGNVSSHFYFIPTIMQFYFLSPLLVNYCKKINYTIGIPLSIFITMITKYFIITSLVENNVINILYKYNDRIFIFYLCYFIIGMYAGKYYNSFIMLLYKKSKILISFYVIILSIHTYLSYLQYMGSFIYTCAEILHTFFCITSLLYLFYICKTISTKNKPIIISLYTSLDTVSLYIYFIHTLFIYFADHLLYNLEIFRVYRRILFKVPYVFILTLATVYLYKFVHGLVFKNLTKRKKSSIV